MSKFDLGLSSVALIGRSCRSFPAWLALLVLAPQIHAQRYPFRLYGPETGLSTTSVRSLIQDQTGFIWVGTSNGLYRYDGSRFRAFHTADGLPGESIRALHQTPKGVLYVGSGVGLSKLVDGRFQRVNFAGATLVDERHGLASDSRYLYVAGNSALTLVPHDSTLPIQSYGAPDQSGPGGIKAVHVDGDGAVWATCGTSLCRFDGKQLKIEPTPGLPRDAYDALITDGTGTLWLRSRGQMFTRARGAAEFRPVPGDFPIANAVTSLSLDPENRVAVPTQFGVYVSDQGSWQRLAEYNGLPADQVSDVLWDREGNLWAGLDTYGLARLLGRGDWMGYTNHDGLSTNTIKSIVRDKDRRLWVGTAYGVNLFMDSTRTWKLWTRREGLPNDDVSAIAADPDRGVWAGFGGGGLSYIASPWAKPVNFGMDEGLDSDRILNLIMETGGPRDGTLWVPTRSALFRANVRQKPIRFERVRVPTHMGESIVHDVLPARNGTLWAGGRQGLLKWTGSEWRQYGAADGLLNQSITFLAEDGEGAIWVGYGPVLGVSRVVEKGGKLDVTHYSFPATLPSNNLSFLKSDPRGRIWIGTDNGISLYDRSQWINISTGDGLIWQDCTTGAFLADSTGEVWIGTRRGLSRFSGARPLVQPSPPAIVITGVEFPDRTIYPGPGTGVPEIPWKERFFRIEFSALTFASETDLRYRYRIPTRGAGWIPVPTPEISLQDLPPGDHTIELQARLMGGAWGPTASFLFQIRAPWWLSWWFRIVAGFFVLGTAGLIYLSRMRGHVVRERVLQEAVSERTRQIEIEKARVEEQKGDIERLLVQTQQAGRLKDEFLANISHEIRTPMHAILGMTALTMATHLNNEQRDYLETVDSSARSLLHLLNEILDFSKIESGAVELEDIPFSLSDVVENVTRTVSALARHKSLKLEQYIDPDVPDAVAGDPTRLRQILLNLHSNAIKFTELGMVRLDVVPVTASGGRVRLRFTVTDTGIGIPSEKQDLIWDPFRQADGSTTRQYGGTGLGLAICRRLVEAMGGQISVESVPGKGSRFTFDAQFGIASESEVTRFSAGQSDAFPTSPIPLRVLLVEDNDVSRRFGTLLLEKQGCTVAHATNGSEAVLMVQQERFDAVLMDLQMPHLDGLAATALIREQDRRKGFHTPVIILTANASSESRNKALEAGADAYLTKPIDLNALTAVLNRICAPAGSKPRSKEQFRPV